MHLPNSKSTTSGALSKQLTTSIIGSYLVTDGDLWSVSFPAANFSVTDLWQQDYRMFRENTAHTTESGWLIGGHIV